MAKERYSGPDLSGNKSSLAGILAEMMPELDSMVSREEIVKELHNRIDPMVGHGISEQTSRKFFFAIEKSRSRYSVIMTISSFMLAGSGMATF